VIPKAHREVAARLDAQQGACGLDFAGGPGGCGAVGASSGRNEAFYSMKEELERRASALGGAPTPVRLFRSRADFESFHLRAGEA